MEDKCAPSPCQNGGSCVNTLSSFDGGFSCECDKGWTGDTCTEGNHALDNNTIIELNFIDFITSKYSNLFISRACFYLKILMNVYQNRVTMELVLMPSTITFAIAIQDGMKKTVVIVRPA